MRCRGSVPAATTRTPSFLHSTAVVEQCHCSSRWFRASLRVLTVLSLSQVPKPLAFGRPLYAKNLTVLIDLQQSVRVTTVCIGTSDLPETERTKVRHEHNL